MVQRNASAVLIAVTCLNSLFAQTTGEIKGRVLDPSGALVQRARIELTNAETGERRIAASDAEGRFAFSLLKVGEYRMAVEAEGFRRLLAAASVRSAETAALDVRLEIGQVNEQVLITDAVRLVQTQSAQMQESISSKTVEEAPVARDPNKLAATLPGITPNVGTFNSGSFFSHGNRARATNITIDNITATDVSTGGTGSSNNGPLNYASLKEVKIITHNFSAELGRNSGAQVQYITKSGTNLFHGEAYEFLRNDAFNARDWFDRTGTVSKLRYNQFGGALGGPIVRNRTHFFAAVERIEQGGAGGSRIAQVPTAAMIARVTDPTAKKLLDQYKLPAATAETAQFGNVQQEAPQNIIQDQLSVRVDHQISSRDSIFGRFGKSHNEGTGASNTFINTNLANFGIASVNSPYSANLNETHLFSGNMVNEVRGGYGRTSPIFDFVTTVPLGPRIQFANGQVDRFGQWDGGPQGRVQNTYQIGDTLSWIRGAHNVRAGGDFYRYQLNSSLDSSTRGVYTFSNWDAFAAGQPSQYQQRFGSSIRGHRTWLQSFFVQDDYRITRTLTLNLGLRSEIYGPGTEVNGFTSNLDFNCKNPAAGATRGPLGCFTVGQEIMGLNHYLQPRLGFAWNPSSGKLVVRGGYGLVSDFNFMNAVTNQRFLPPFIVSSTLTTFTGGNSFANLVAGTAPTQADTIASIGRIRTDAANFGDVNPTIDPSLENPQVHQWSLGIERELPGTMVLKVSYAGTKANRLQRMRQVNLNAAAPRRATSVADETARLSEFTNSYNRLTGSLTTPSGRLDPRFNTVNYYDNSANSNYHGLEIFVHRPFRSGYQFSLAYTFSKSIDDISDALTTIPNDTILVQDPNNLRANRALSGFSTPHRLVLVHTFEPRYGSNWRNPILRYAIRGWGFSGISSWRSGFPVTFEAGARLGINNIPLLTTSTTAEGVRVNANSAFSFRPVAVGSPGAPQGVNSDPVATKRISTYAESLGLSQPLLGNFGTLGRNTHSINGQSNLDWNAYKNVAISESWQVQMRCEMYNAFNMHSFRDVQRNITNPGFGQYTSPDQSQRILQLGARIIF